MELSRRKFLELLTAAGVSTMASGWMSDRVLALAAEGELPVAPGPGIETWVKTACGLCQGGCGLQVRRIDGLPVGLRGDLNHVVNHGKMCSLGHAGIQILFGPDRLRQPLKRGSRRGQGDWTKISWEEAESIIEERVRTLVSAGSRERIAFLDGRRQGLGQMVVEAFMRGLGSQYITYAERRADALAGQMFGWQQAPGADLERSHLIALFGFDHLESDGAPVWQSRVYGEARDRTINRPVYISVGPRLLGSATKADFWLPARPGTEGIVALAMAHVILQHGWEDRAFLRQATDWIAAGTTVERDHARLLMGVTPALASEMTDVPAEMIEIAARQFIEHQPGIALAGPGTLAAPTGTLTLWAVNLLNVLVGGVGKRGGMVRLEAAKLAPVWEPGEKPNAQVAAAKVITGPAQLARALLDAEPVPIDLLFIRDANPAFDSSLARAFGRGLTTSNDRMIVAFVTELDETAELADLVLPEPSGLERWDILTGTPIYPRGHASLQQPAIGPLFSARQSEEVIARLNNALGDVSGITFPKTSPAEMAKQASRGLLADGRGRIYRAGGDGGEAKRQTKLRRFWKDFQEHGLWAFDEPAGASSPATRRIVILPELVMKGRHEMLAHDVARLIKPRSVGDPHRYPYELVVFRTAQIRDGERTNVPMMMELVGHWAGATWNGWVEMPSRMAAGAGIRNGDLVRIISELGHIEAVAYVSPATPPGIVGVPLGFGHRVGSTAGGVGGNVNRIMASTLDESGGIPGERVTRVSVVKV